MIQVCPINLCSGCGACASVCPKNCITLSPDKHGHLVAKIDQSKCINCGACVKICPVNNPLPFNAPKACYAAWAKDESERVTSASGGVASVLARHIIKQGGAVYGAACLKGCEIGHIRIEKEEDAALLKGSKYVNSFCGGVYKKIKQDLNDGKKVLFVGTPCQSAGVLKAFGGNKNLFTVDLICHGVPSLQMLRDTVLTETGTLDIDKVVFREGNEFKFSLFSGGKNIFTRKLMDARWKEHYMEAFLRNLSFRTSCFSCFYTREARVSDLTIGDFWGLGKDAPFEGDIKNGCSVILVNTERGQELFDGIKENMNCFARRVKEAVDGNPMLRHCAVYNYNVMIFRFLYPKISFKKAVFISCLDRFIIYKIRKMAGIVK